ncbi:vanomycin resistance protein VanB [Blastococcus sp. TF02-09]|uniref:VanW family protein n=1 Tax=Blastococcus sp. TF02-09 TaxID=2250576 RepID=UPI000DEBF97C|nr:VanW family protein [Blastococcus sp. TF02-9]RBY75207.1 vanomycin resistance protein VanB [Blastococcus sp. TF02-9]
MSQPPGHDETVRLRADGAADSRPPVEPSRPLPDEGDTPEPQNSSPADREVDDTRPVPRDWLSGAPEQEAVQTTAVAEPVAAPAVPSADVPDTDTDTGTALFLGADVAGGNDGDGPPPTATDGAPGSPWWRRRAVLVPAGAVAVLAALYGADLLLSSGDVPRSTVVAGVEIGGLSPAAAAEALQSELGDRVAADRPIAADGVEGVYSPTRAGVRLDAEGTVAAADDQPLNPWTRVTSFFSDREVEPIVAVDDSAVADELGSFDAQLATFAEQVDRAPVDATIAIEDTTASVVPPTDGRTLDREGARDVITAALTDEPEAAGPLELPVEVAPVQVEAAEAERVLAETVEPALAAPVAVTGGADGATAEVPAEAIAASLTFTPTEDGALTVGIDPAELQAALGDELAVFGTPARDATFEVSGGSVRVVPSVDGTGIDPAHLAEQLMPVLDDPAPRSIAAEPGPVPAELTTQEAEALGIREEISSFTTNISNPRSGENIRVVAAEVDGALVLPGETFSLNTFTGPRGTAQGYVPATVISGGELSTAVGGGISQFATTMFNAVFFAGLEDIYHKPHSFYISRYPAGREATVYEGAIDLQWRNDSDTGVYVDTRWTPSALTVTFYGTKRYEIESISSERRNTREPAVIEKVDDGDCIPQSGVPGFDITVTRVFKDLASGAEIEREDFRTRYNAEAVINCVPAPEGEGGAPASPSPGPEGTPPAGAPASGGRRPGDRRPVGRRVR